MVRWDMETTNSRDSLAEIAKFSQELAERRGPYAAALWSVHDFFASCDGSLIAHRDSVDLAQRTDTRLEIAPDDNGRWGLEIVDGDGRLPAYKAEAELQAAAVRRVPEFLAAYSKRLKEAAGSKVTVSLADQLVEAVATLETEASA